MEKRDGFVPKEDIEFERELRQQEQQDEAERQRLDDERREAEEKERAEYEKNLQDKKIELVKLRQGVIDSSDVIKEVHEEKPKLTLGQKISGAWYRSKWLIIFVIVITLAFAYIIYDMVTAEKPDFTVLVVSNDTALYYRTPEVEAFFESFCDDVNGDGEVNVLIYNISTDYSADPTMASSHQAQLMTQLQDGENVLVVADAKTDFELIDFRGEYPEDKNITELGLLLNCQYVRDALKWEAMPDGVYLGVRNPTKLLSTSEEEMQKQVDLAMPAFERIREAVGESEK